MQGATAWHRLQTSPAAAHNKRHTARPAHLGASGGVGLQARQQRVARVVRVPAQAWPTTVCLGSTTPRGDSTTAMAVLLGWGLGATRGSSKHLLWRKPGSQALTPSNGIRGVARCGASIHAAQPTQQQAHLRWLRRKPGRWASHPEEQQGAQSRGASAPWASYWLQARQ
jgi:hypothetical protein